MNRNTQLGKNAGLDSVRLEASLEDVLVKLRETGRHCLPVVDGEQRCFGVIGATDLAKIDQRESGAMSLRAWELCSHELVTVNEAASPKEVAEVMLRHGVHHVLIREDGRLTGIVSSMDVIGHYVSTAQG